MLNFDTLVVLIVALPLLVAVGNGLNLVAGEQLWGWRGVQRSTWLALLAAFLGAIWLFVLILIDPTPREVIVYQWMATAGLRIDVGFLIDALSAVMILVVTGFSFLIAAFSINYMHNDFSFSRYFSGLSLFVFAMLVLVMGNNFVMLFLGWEAVGLCSYLLIGHYYDRKSAARAGTKAFVMNRIGDAGFLIGIFLIASNFGSVTYSEVFDSLYKIDQLTATAIGLCLLMGAVGKSAQLPLGTWLAKAMEGPTPSSALIHAATMVTAGVYMITRSHDIYDMAPIALAAVTIIGALTAAYGATVGKTISDIKGILAASTTTQLGLMFVACGLGAYPVAIFHLVAHAFLKTFLFLTAPSILHYFHSFPDANAVDKVSPPVPVVCWLILVGSVGLLAYPFGISLVDGSAAVGLSASLFVLAAAGIMAAFTTLYYALAATQRIFAGHQHGSLHGSTQIPVAVPVLAFVVALGIGILLGLLPGGLVNSWFADLLSPTVNMAPTAASQSPLSFLIVISIGLLILSAWAMALFMDRFHPEVPGLAMIRARGLYTAAMRRFWLDDFYHQVVVAGCIKLGRWLDQIDSRIIDRIVGAPAAAARIQSANTTWETRYLAARSAGVTADAAKTSLGDDVLSWLTLSNVRRSSTTQQPVSNTQGGVAGALTGIASKSAAIVEKDMIASGQGLLSAVTKASAIITNWVEYNIFELGVHSGVSQTGGTLGKVLYMIEERLGHPIIIGIFIIAAISGPLWGVLS